MQTVMRNAAICDDASCLLDSEGRRVAYGDPRVVHVLSDIPGPFAARIAQAAYRKHGKRCRAVGRANEEVLQYSRKVCSGRECLPMMAMTGAAVRDMLERHADSDLSIYFSIDQEGPCQNGAWPLVWDTFLRRLGVRNVIAGVSRNSTPGRLGLEGTHLNALNAALFLGDLFEEAHNTVRCLARDTTAALERFERAMVVFLADYERADGAFEAPLRDWAAQMAGTELSMPPEAAPKVLIQGGLNLLFVHYPVTDYFIAQGVLPKVVDSAEGACFLESEGALRYGVLKGRLDPCAQFARSRDQDSPEAVSARKSRLTIRRVEDLQRKFRSLLAPSGLLFDRHIPFLEVVEAGHGHVSVNSFSETTVTTGRFVRTVEQGYYDGIVNMSSFNCQPAINAQAVIRPIANKTALPYVALDCEGPWISTNQRRLLETVAVRAKRRKARASA